MRAGTAENGVAPASTQGQELPKPVEPSDQSTNSEVCDGVSPEGSWFGLLAGQDWDPSLEVNEGDRLQLLEERNAALTAILSRYTALMDEQQRIIEEQHDLVPMNETERERLVRELRVELQIVRQEAAEQRRISEELRIQRNGLAEAVKKYEALLDGMVIEPLPNASPFLTACAERATRSIDGIAPSGVAMGAAADGGVHPWDNDFMGAMPTEIGSPLGRALPSAFRSLPVDMHLKNLGAKGPPRIISGVPEKVAAMNTFSLHSDEGLITVRARSRGTAYHLKRMVAIQLHISPRLDIQLQVSGRTLRDDAPIEQYDDSHAQRLSLVIKPRPLSEFMTSEAQQTIKQLRIRPTRRGTAMDTVFIATPVSATTTVSELQLALSRATQLLPAIPSDPASIRLLFSPVFVTPDLLLGRKSRVLMNPESSLARCQVVNDDILYLEY